MPDFMLTVIGSTGARDVQVNSATDIRDAIGYAERVTGCRVDHGRGGILPEFNPAVIIDAESGAYQQRHDMNALESMKIAVPEQISIPKG